MSSLVQEVPLARGAESRWEEAFHPLVWTLDRYGPWLLAAFLAALVVRALVTARRYRALSVLGPAESERVRAAIADVERRTSGEIVTVVVERSDRHPDAEWSSALVFLLLGSALLENVIPWHAAHVVLAVQMLLGVCGFLLARVLPGWKRVFVAEHRATEMSDEQAAQEFARHGLHATRDRTGVLVFVSLFERRVVVLADEGIHAPAGVAAWERTRDAILAGAKRGDLASGLVDGVRCVGDVLVRHAPPRDERNELPDHLVVRRE